MNVLISQLRNHLGEGWSVRFDCRDDDKYYAELVYCGVMQWESKGMVSLNNCIDFICDKDNQTRLLKEFGQ